MYPVTSLVFFSNFTHHDKYLQVSKHDHDKSLLFDRISDSFVALFTSVNPEIRDKVFHVSNTLHKSPQILSPPISNFSSHLRYFATVFSSGLLGLPLTSDLRSFL